MPVARLVQLVLLVCLLTPVAALRAHAEPAVTDYSVAVVPAIPPSDIKRRWQRLLDQLGHDTGLHFHFRFYEDNQAFEAGMQRREADFAMLGPVQLWKLRSQYRPLVRDSLPLVGMVVVAKAGPLQQLTDLNGKRLGIPDGTDFAANVFLRQALADARTEPVMVPVHTQSNGFRNVIVGKVDAATVNNYSIRLLPAEITRQLRIIHSSSELPPPAFSVAVHVTAEDAQKVKNAFLHFRQTHPEMLESALMPNIVEADFDRDYAMLAKLMAPEAGNAPH